MSNDKKTFESLTARQLQVISLVGEGLSNKEIANRLKISEGTVKQHIFFIFRILNVSSRAKLALLSSRIDSSSALKIKQIGTQGQDSLAYSSRLIIAVAVSIQEFALNDDVAKVIHQKHDLDQFRKALIDIVIALDAMSMATPDGGFLIWFGHPVTHIDDADRAAILVQSIRSYINTHQFVCLHIGLGIAARTEVIPMNTKVLTVACAFRRALALSEKSVNLKLSLADALTEHLCCASIPWMELRPTKSSSATALTGSEEYIYAISDKPDYVQSIHSKWGDIPFLNEVLSSVRGGLAQWLAVDSWPPTMANSLVDAIGLTAAKEKFFTLKLYIPHGKRKDVILSSLLTQIEFAGIQFDLSSDKPESTLDRFLFCLWKISNVMPIALQVFGIQSLVTFKDVIGEKGIDRLVGLKVLLVGTYLHDIKEPQTSIQVLGPRPDNSIFTRKYTMQEPEAELHFRDTPIDIQAMVDDLTPAAKQLISAISAWPDRSFKEVLSLIDFPRPVLQTALQELLATGLIMRRNHQYEFRDQKTAQAISELHHLAVAQ